MKSLQELQKNAQRVSLRTPTTANILIVDDQRFDRKRLNRMCSELGLDVTISEADTLESMGTAIGADTFDLIFLDQHLPDGTGMQALEAIQFDPRNKYAATIMVTGDEQTDVAIDAMKNGCSDFLRKDVLSDASVRRAVINALQKANLNQNLETQQVMRGNVEAVLDNFAKECADELKPMIYNMLRHTRDLGAVRTDAERHGEVVKKIKNACERLCDFMNDIEDHDRKTASLSQDVGEFLYPNEADKPPQPDSIKNRLFRGGQPR